MGSSKMDAWVESMIAGCRPGAVPRVAAAEQQLADAVAFFDGRGATIFGMDATPARFADPAALRRLAVDALRAWLDAEATAGNHRGCVTLVEMARRRGVSLDFEIPPALSARGDAERERAQRLAALPSPLTALGKLLPDLAYTIGELPRDLDARLVEQHASLLTHPHGVALPGFEWSEDDWSALPERPTDPSFFPLGEGGGAHLGLYLDGPSLALGVPPPVVCLAGDDASCIWIAKGLGWLDEMVEAAVRNKGKHRAPKVETARGARHESVDAALDPARRGERLAAAREVIAARTDAERDAALARFTSAFPEASHAFAIASLEAQRLRGLSLSHPGDAPPVSTDGWAIPPSVAQAGHPPIPPFRCPRCHAVHEGGEPGFGLPDAAYALTLSADEREVLAQHDDEDVATVRDTFFVRSVAYFPILGSPLWLGIGFWVRLPAEAFADFEAHERVNHPSYEGRIANQSMYFTPTLGLPVRVDFLGLGVRPSAVFTDPSHPLGRAQRGGIDAQLADAWRAECLHMGDPAPIDAPWRADLATHGFELLAPEEVGRQPATPARPPAPGDKVKVGVGFLASDEAGSPTRLHAAWWVALDDVQRPDLWGGTLASHPRVPATIHLGSRLWVEPRHVLEYAG